MCKKKQFEYCPSEIDLCMEKLIEMLKMALTESKWKTVACCCGHGKYPMTVVIQNIFGARVEIFSGRYIPRKRNFYKKDKQGYYYIPETLEGQE